MIFETIRELRKRLEKPVRHNPYWATVRIAAVKELITAYECLAAEYLASKASKNE